MTPNSLEGAFNWASLQPALPEIYLTAAICVLLLADVFFGDRRRGLAPTLTLLILVGGAFVTMQYATVSSRVLLFGDSYVADGLAVWLKLFGFVVIALALLYSREYLERRGMMRGEYYVLALTSLLGIFVMVSANSLLTVYIGVELMSLSLYAMVAFDRDSGIAAESAMKYFVLGAIASGILLYGMSLVYGL
ncbi:MAG TPA: proton-conducting transporter membrane subunit, partial [Steroidobacteraceae bacterium]|nr:proton-conducting transporter membrane subunit [Steroidobacteraceae bacterium]